MMQYADTLLFVYGTLRTGENLHRYIASSVIDVWDATISGLLYANTHDTYPMCKVGGEGTVIGETLQVWLTGEVLDLFKMEIQSGYRPTWTDEQDMEGTPTGRQVLTFDYLATEDALDAEYTRIVHGDWKKYADASWENG